MLRSGTKARPGKYPVLQGTVLGWTLSIRSPATNTRHDPQHTFLLQEDKFLEHSLNRFWKVETVEHSTMTKEHQACEQHFIPHKPKNQMEDLLSDCQQRWTPSNFDLLASLQIENYMQLNADWTGTRTQVSIPQFHKGI